MFTYDYDHVDIKYIGTSHIDDNNGITGARFAWHKDQPWRSNLTILLRYGSSNKYFWWRVGYKHTPGYSGRGTAVFATSIPNPFKTID